MNCSIGLAQAIPRHQFRDNAIFARAEKCALCAHGKEQRVHGIGPVKKQSQTCKAHQPEFPDLGQHNDVAFTETVGQLASHRRKQQKGDHKDYANDHAEPTALVYAEFSNQEEQNEPAKDVVV